MAVLLVFVVGLFVGSFLGVLAVRVPESRSPFVGRSACDVCGHVLAWYDLIPLASYLGVRGRCRYCKVELSAYYPAIELTTGLAFAVAYVATITYFGSSVIALLALLVLTSAVIVVVFMRVRPSRANQ